ncbi:MAG: sugar phosphate nucleotidyltransferase [Alphaproteobacteria bacterium]|nr:sugar phosphate nucleotidyltransferase [Alphaproteobacteria bacterium]
MKIAILAGGRGSRLAEETDVKSKAMVPIGDEPVLWHIMRYYAHFGFTEFVIALGYQAGSIQQYFEQTGEPRADRARAVEHRCYQRDGLTIDLVDTGLDTENGGRIKRLEPFLDNSAFMLTWCDGLADIDLDKLLAFHRDHGRLATLSAVHPPARFGRLMLDGASVCDFQEKIVDPNKWINGAYFVLEPGVLDLIDDDDTHFESQTLARLARDCELMAYRHESFWQCMDTLKEARALNALWREGRAPWKR